MQVASKGEKRMRVFRSLLPALVAAASFITPVHAAAQGSSFRAAAVKVDITPQASKWLAGYPARQSNGVHDRLFHRIVALDDGHTQFFFVASDLCLFAPGVYDEVTARLRKEENIAPVQVWWTVTHTHSAPEVGPHGLGKVMMPERYTHEPDAEYTAFVEQAMIDGIKQARSKLAPARLSVGTGYSAANINRRARDTDGQISLGLNPDGPTDRRINLIRLERPDGSPIALLANYAMHGTALGPQNKLISGDAPAIVAAYVEEKLGAPMLYINGAAGNLAPIYTVQQDFAAAHITEFNVLLGDKILAANKSMTTATSEVRLRPGEQSVETARRAGFGWDASLGDYLRAAKGEAGTIRLPVRFLLINDDIALWSAPVELFCEIAMGIRDRSPFPNTFYFGYANGWLGYLPTRRAYHEGGYETKTNPFTEQVEDDITGNVLAYLQGHAR
jgi:hypothetical protein